MVNNLPYMTDKETNKIYIETFFEECQQIIKCNKNAFSSDSAEVTDTAFKKTLKIVVISLITIPFKSNVIKLNEDRAIEAKKTICSHHDRELKIKPQSWRGDIASNIIIKNDGLFYYQVLQHILSSKLYVSVHIYESIYYTQSGI